MKTEAVLTRTVQQLPPELATVPAIACSDTPPEIAEMVRAKLMARSGEERFRMGVEMFEAARRMVLASFPQGLTEAERKRRLFERVYGMPLPYDE